MSGLPPIRFERPNAFSMSKTLWMRGLRMSASISSTRLSLSAMVIARLTAVSVLPSCCPGLVTTNTRGGLSGEEKSRLVRTAR